MLFLIVIQQLEIKIKLKNKKNFVNKKLINDLIIKK